MKSIWFLSAFIAAVSCTELLPVVDQATQQVLDEVSVLSGITLLDDNPVFDIEDEVKFFLTTRATRNVPPTQIYIDDVNLAVNLQSKPIVFIIHGWIESMNKPWVTKLAQAWLDAVDYNVIIVDYEKLASYFYTIAAIRYAPQVGEFVCDFLEALEDGGISGSSITIVGHSLGGQVAGLAGACFGDLGTIYALDAAGPLFTTPLPVATNKRLDKSDAHWVSAIHTSSLLGSLYELGHSDFYMGGGTEIQCGCVPPASDVTNKVEPLCSHQMSITYLIHTLDSTIKCKGIKGCSNLLNFIKSKVCAYDALSVLLLNPYKLNLLQILNYGICEYDDYGIYSARKLGSFYVPTKVAPPHCFG